MRCTFQQTLDGNRAHLLGLCYFSGRVRSTKVVMKDLATTNFTYYRRDIENMSVCFGFFSLKSKGFYE